MLIVLLLKSLRWRSRHQSRQGTGTSRWALSIRTQNREPPRGFEPRTDGLRNHCSTAELRRLASARLLYGPRSERRSLGRNSSRLGTPGLAHHEIALLDIYQHRVALGKLAVEDRQGQRVLDAALNHPLQRSGDVVRVVALVRDQLHGRRRKLQRDVPLGQPLAQPFQLDIDDRLDLLPAERLEDDD